MSRQIKIEHAKLGRNKAFGMAENATRTIVVDEGAHSHERDLMDTYIHESLHIAQPELSEEAVVRVAAELADVMWRVGYRRVILPKRGARTKKR